VIPVDQAARDRALQDFSTNFCVEAGAGTGKTTILVGRILNMVREGRASLRRLAAITFTEKAAGELKVRLRQKIDEARAGATAEEARRLEEAAADLETAAITTIHGFAASLLRERPVEAGVDPDFEVLDPVQREVLLEEVWADWLEARLQESCDTLRRALALGITLKQVKGLAQNIINEPEARPPSAAPHDRREVDSFLDRLRQAVEELADLAERHCEDKSDKGYLHIQELVQAVESQEDFPSAEAFIMTGIKVEKNAGNQKNWSAPEHCRYQKEVCGELAAELDRLRASIGRDITCRLVNLLFEFRETWQREKAERGFLDFNDLLLRARDLLRDNFEVRREFQEAFDHILVDEFQDTDPLQAEIVFFLAEDPSSSPARDWQEVRLGAGRLFVVGDPKQSIYRFRRADIETYERARELIESSPSGELLRITQNFRTVPEIIDWANQLFDGLFEESVEGAYQPRYVPLYAYRSGRKGSGVRLLTAPADFAPSGVAEARALEPVYVAALIRQMVDKGLEVEDPDTGDRRAVRYADIGILLPAFTGAEALEEALRAADIPYRITGGRMFYFRDEVRSLISLLKAIDNPYDEVAVVAALRSQYFACTDEELLAWKASGKSFSRVQKEDEGYVATCLAVLSELHRLRGSEALGRFLSRVYRRTAALQKQYARPHPGQGVANLVKVLEQARAFDAAGGTSFRAFVRWLDGMVVEGRDEAESPMAEEDTDAVQVLSIHRAKGLEFPVVILANLNSTLGRGIGAVLDRSSGALEVKLGSKDGPFTTPGWAGAQEAEKRRVEAELVRLFYVAVTRARDHLVICDFRVKEGKGFYKYLLPDLTPACERTLCDELEPVDLKAAGRPSKTSDDVSQNRDAWRRELEERLARGRRGPTFVSPSALEKTPDGAGGRRERGVLLGTAFHRLAERPEFYAGSRSELETAVERLAGELNLRPDEADLVLDMAVRCRALPVMQRAVEGPRYVEVPFVLCKDGVVVEGYVDLVFRDGDDIVLVDFKTDDVSPQDADKRAQGYEGQMALYAAALEDLVGRPPARVYLVFVSPGVEVEMDGPELARRGHELPLASVAETSE